MLNQVILVGRMVDKPELKILEDGKKSCKIILAVLRSFKNENGEYDTDFIDCQLWSTIAENTIEYVNKGDLIGIKGRLQTENGQLLIIAEKVTFLSSKKKEEE